MTDHESDRSVRSGSKKGELLTRQTGDGSFEILVDEPSGDDALVEETPRPVSRKRWPALAVVGGGLVLALVGFAIFSGGGDGPAPGANDRPVEVPGFRPYGGGESGVQPIRGNPGRTPAPQEPDDELFDDEDFEGEDFEDYEEYEEEVQDDGPTGWQMHEPEVKDTRVVQEKAIQPRSGIMDNRTIRPEMIRTIQHGRNTIVPGTVPANMRERINSIQAAAETETDEIYEDEFEDDEEPINIGDIEEDYPEWEEMEYDDY